MGSNPTLFNILFACVVQSNPAALNTFFAHVIVAGRCCTTLLLWCARCGPCEQTTRERERGRHAISRSQGSGLASSHLHHALPLGKHQSDRVYVFLTIVVLLQDASRHFISHPLLQAMGQSSQARAAVQAGTGRWTWPGSYAPHALAAHASSSMTVTAADKKPLMVILIDPMCIPHYF